MENKSSIRTSFSEAYLEYKSNFKSYMFYSLILFGIGIATNLFEDTLLYPIVALAGMYFGIRVTIAMNYKAYMSYRGKNYDFSSEWQYSKGRALRYFGASLIIGAICAMFFGLWVICLVVDIGIIFKILLSVILAIGFVYSLWRLCMITYIASITNKHESYMSFNNLLIKKHGKEVAALVALLLLPFIPIIIIVLLFLKEPSFILILLGITTLIYPALEILITPYISCYAMRLLVELPVSIAANEVEEGVSI